MKRYGVTTLAEVRAALERARAGEVGWIEMCANALSRLPADGVIVTPDSLARALHAHHCADAYSTVPIKCGRRCAAAVLAALAAEGGPG